MLLRAVVQQPDLWVLHSEADLGIRRSEQGELAKHYRLAFGIGAAIAQQGYAAAGIGYCGTQRRALYANV